MTTQPQPLAQLISALPSQKSNSSTSDESKLAANGTPEEYRTMSRQLLKYNLSVIDRLTSKELTQAESNRAKCTDCPGYNACTQPAGQEGFKPYITVLETQQSSETIREVYLAYQECQYRLERKFAARNARLFASSGIPKEYSGRTLTNLPESALTLENALAYEALIELVNHLDSNTGTTYDREIYLEGQTNTGKTYLASLTGNEAISRGYTVMYRTTPELLLNLRYTKDTYPEDLLSLATADLVILEDLSGEIWTFLAEQLLAIIDRRQREGTCLIVTGQEPIERVMSTNGTPGERLRNRLKRMRHVKLG